MKRLILALTFCLPLFWVSHHASGFQEPAPTEAAIPQDAPPAGEAPAEVPNDTKPTNEATPAPPTAAAPAVPPATAVPPPAPPLERVPYRVRIELVVDLGFEDSPATRQRFREELTGLLSDQVGAFWEFEFSPEGGSWLSSPSDVARRRESDFERYKDTPEDKVLILGVDGTGNETIATAREWDAATRTLGPLRSRRTSDSRDAVSCAVRVIHAAFRPLVQIEQSKEGTLTLRARSGQIPPHDESWNPLREGTIFEPFYRHLNRERRLEKVVRIPWTYVVSGAPVPEEGQAAMRTVSGLRVPISAKRRRIEAVGLAVPIQEEPTVVRLLTRPPTSKPIVGVEVVARAELFVPIVPEGEAPPPPLARLVSDRRGDVTIPYGLVPRGAPVWLFIYSGSQLLGRVPLVSGVRPREELELADDSLRLQVEGEIALLQASLVDLAAQRAVLMALVRKRAADKDFAASDALFKKIDETAKPPALLAELNTIRSPNMKLARDQRDKATEARIKKLCDDTAEIINVHFGPERIAELREEIDELKAVAADEAAGLQPRPKKERPKKTSTKTKKKAAATNEPPAEIPPSE